MRPGRRRGRSTSTSSGPAASPPHASTCSTPCSGSWTTSKRWSPASTSARRVTWSARSPPPGAPWSTSSTSFPSGWTRRAGTSRDAPAARRSVQVPLPRGQQRRDARRCGMPLSAGVVTIDNGDIDFGDFKQLAYLNLGQPDVTIPRVRREHLPPLERRAQLPGDGGVAELHLHGTDLPRHGPERRVRRGGRCARGRRGRPARPARGDRAGRARRCHLRRQNVEQKVLNESYITFGTLDERGTASRCSQSWPR